MSTKQGWLAKHSRKGAGEVKRRWFVLEGNELKYSLKPKSEAKSIDLTGYTAELAPECKKQPAFKLVHGKRAMYIVCETQALCKSWIEAINAAKRGEALPETPVVKMTVNDFKPLTVLGRGTYGKVQLVRCLKDGRLYAMKSMSKRLLAESDQLEQTITERSVLLRANHPFVVGARFTFQSETKLFMIMDYVPGGELFGRLKEETTFNESRVKLYAAEMTLGIGHLHKIGIIYRDLKPENILVDRDGHLRLADFGLAKEVADDGTAKTFCGTPEYIAPEMLEKKPYTKAVDWWSFGTLVYEMLTGLPPFYDENTKNMYDLVCRASVEFPDDIPLSDEVQDFILKLLNKDPKKRLGGGPDDVEEVKRHPFFAGVKWDEVLAKKTKPQWVPKLKGATDTGLFDKEFTDERAGVSFEDASMIPPEAVDSFQDFTCTADCALNDL